MKYNGFSVVKNFYYNFNIQYLKIALQTHLKTCYTVPKSAIYYSARYNAGEDFLLNNKTLYPFRVDNNSSSKDVSGLHLAYKVDNSLSELNIYKLEEGNSKVQSLFSGDKLRSINDQLSESLADLYKIYKYVEPSKREFSAFIIARILYALSQNNSAVSRSNFDEESYIDLLKSFIEKAKFADSDSLALVLSSLSTKGVFSNEYWTPLLNRLNEVKFEPEFTKVTNTSPHLFYYKESSSEFSKETSDFTNKVFFDGYRSILLVYKSLTLASKNNVQGSSELLKSISSRVDLSEFENSDKLNLL